MHAPFNMGNSNLSKINFRIMFSVGTDSSKVGYGLDNHQEENGWRTAFPVHHPLL